MDLISSLKQKMPWIVMIGGFGVVISAVIIIFMVKLSPQQTPSEILVKPTYFPIPQLEDAHVVKITPEKTTILTPGSTQTFTIEFDKPISAYLVNLTASRLDISNDKPIPVEYISSSSLDGKTLTITLDTPVIGLSRYDIAIRSRGTNKSFFEVSYLSDKPQPTRIPKNNPLLAQYLPYETKTYRIVYDQAQNSYVFNFKLDPESPDDLDTQFAKAKADAIRFIQSKGIDISTVIIEWRSS